jgi:hypothetical protein
VTRFTATLSLVSQVKPGETSAETAQIMCVAKLSGRTRNVQQAAQHLPTTPLGLCCEAAKGCTSALVEHRRVVLYCSPHSAQWQPVLCCGPVHSAPIHSPWPLPCARACAAEPYVAFQSRPHRVAMVTTNGSELWGYYGDLRNQHSGIVTCRPTYVQDLKETRLESIVTHMLRT